MVAMRCFLVVLATSMLVGACAGSEAETTGDQEEAVTSSLFTVNGHALNARESRWMRYVAENVVPRLPGSRDDRLRIASRSTWWALKEGVFDTTNPVNLSNCNFPEGDRLIGPTAACAPRRAWQVGLAAIQVPGHTEAELATVAAQVYPDKSVERVLQDVATEAGHEPLSVTSNAILHSTGYLRVSWLLRDSVIGFLVLERSEVVPECIQGSRRWCYGTGWETTARYAPTKAAALRAIGDIERGLGAIAP